ncbi:MAG TPA: hypothetical protein VHS81_01705 [Caulobacteraceae bacterium]|jgi:hypothetical protein|nr:hypothetical protein [Caulobacteraceae bacterium]
MSLANEAADLVGPMRIPRNTASQSRGSIHDDATASKLGFKGGTVAGSLHMDQFAPLALQLYGEDWWKLGNMSFYFRQATVDQEAVRAFVHPGEPHARLWMENEAGALIAEGTGSCKGSDEATAVENLMKSQTIAEPGGLKILANVKVGDEVTGLEVTVSREAVERRMETITEHLAEYDGENGILPPSMMVHLFRGSAQEKLYKTDGGAVGLFGAIELQSMGAPTRCETPYLVRAKVLALSESPKTENVWYRAWAADPATGEDVCSMLMYLRYMKASSKHYAA